MEKVTRWSYIILVLLVFRQVGISQELISTGSIYYNSYKVNQKSSRVSAADVRFNEEAKPLDNLFTVEGTLDDAWSAGVMYGLGLKWDKNLFNVKIGAGVDEYNYHLNFKQIDTIPSSIGSNTQTGQNIWESVRNPVTLGREINGAIASPYVNFELGYSRAVWSYKGWEFLPSIELRYRKSFFDDKLISQSFLQSLDFRIEDGNSDFIEFPTQQYLKLKEHTFFMNLGVDFRHNASVYGVRYGFSLGEVSGVENVGVFKISGFNFSYAKVLDVRKLAKEQLIADADMGIPSVKTRKYRKGDRMFYASYFFDSKQSVAFDYSSVKIDSNVNFKNSSQDNLGHVKELYGVTVRPNVSLKFGATSFFTHRLALGVEIGVYIEKINNYGRTLDSAGVSYYEVVENQDFRILKNDVFAADNFYVDSKLYPNVVFNSAIYIFKYQLPVDPFVKGSLNLVLLPETRAISQILENTPNTIDYGEPYFSIYTLSAGVDVKLRMRSSKYLLLSVIGDYHIHPHGNFMQLGLRLGRYKKKKLKNQRY